MSRKIGHLLVDGGERKADLQYHFELGEVINYMLDGVSIHPVTTKIQASIQTPVRDFTMRTMVTLKPVTECIGCDRNKLTIKLINNIVVTPQY